MAVYSKEFRRKAVELYLRRRKDKSVASELGVGYSTLCKWEKSFRDELNPVVISEAEELKQLRKDNARLREEVEILKKLQRFSRRTSYPGNEVRFYRRRTLLLQHCEIMSRVRGVKTRLSCLVKA